MILICLQAKELREVDLGGRPEPISPSVGICCLWCRLLILWRRFLSLWHRLLILWRRFLILWGRILTDGLRMLYSTLWFILQLWTSTSFTFDHSYHVQKKVLSAKMKNLKNWITELVHRSKNRNCLGKFIHRYNLLEKVKCLTSIVTDRHVAVKLERHPFNCPSSKHQYSKYGSILAVKVILLFKDGQER